MKFKAKNINCQNCANTIKKALSDEFGAIEVDIDNKIVDVKIDEKNIENFKAQMDDLGFEIEKRVD